ncbi:MAG: hypothetical protein FD152_1686 [Xanthobacteraceae bacterium]|nr:MAG: hypothetical protein FD152_1686 [Xanthobacteraceae bacterium]
MEVATKLAASAGGIVASPISEACISSEPATLVALAVAGVVGRLARYFSVSVARAGMTSLVIWIGTGDEPSGLPVVRSSGRPRR